MAAPKRLVIDGSVSKRFEPVREAFIENFTRRPSESFRFGHAGAFGHPGARGSMGYADPEVGIGYGCVTNRMGMHLHGDRDVALRAAIPAIARRSA